MGIELIMENEINSKDQNLPSAKPLGAKVHIMCGWPLILVLVGGLIGGGLGGAAYVINLKIYKSGLQTPIKIVLNLVVGISAALLWLVLATIVHAISLHD